MTNNINTQTDIVSPDGEGSVYSTDSSLFNRASSSVIDVGCKGAGRGTRGKGARRSTEKGSAGRSIGRGVVVQNEIPLSAGRYAPLNAIATVSVKGNGGEGGQCTLSSTRSNSWEHKTKTGKATSSSEENAIPPVSTLEDQVPRMLTRRVNHLCIPQGKSVTENQSCNPYAVNSANRSPASSTREHNTGKATSSSEENAIPSVSTTEDHVHHVFTQPSGCEYVGESSDNDGFTVVGKKNQINSNGKGKINFVNGKGKGKLFQPQVYLQKGYKGGKGKLFQPDYQPQVYLQKGYKGGRGSGKGKSYQPDYQPHAYPQKGYKGGGRGSGKGKLFQPDYQPQAYPQKGCKGGRGSGKGNPSQHASSYQRMMDEQRQLMLERNEEVHRLIRVEEKRRLIRYAEARQYADSRMSSSVGDDEVVSRRLMDEHRRDAEAQQYADSQMSSSVGDDEVVSCRVENGKVISRRLMNGLRKSCCDDAGSCISVGRNCGRTIGMATNNDVFHTIRAVGDAGSLNTTIDLTINGVCQPVCRKYVDLCAALGKDKWMHKCDHAHNDPRYPHLKLPICFHFTTEVGCTQSNCKYHHPLELNGKERKQDFYAAKKEVDYDSDAGKKEPKTHMDKFSVECKNYAWWKFNPARPECKGGGNGRPCNFAHGAENVKKYPHIAQFENVLNGSVKMPADKFQKIFEEVYRVLKENWSYVKRLFLEEGKHTRRDILPQPVRTNFIELLLLWSRASRLARKLKEENKLHLFDGVECPDELFAMVLASRMVFCDKYIKLEANKIRAVEMVDGVEKETSEGYLKRKTKYGFCEFSSNCKAGSHGELLCLDEICGHCECTIKSKEEAFAQRVELTKELRSLQEKRVAVIAEKNEPNQKNNHTNRKSARYELDQLNRDIALTAKTIADTVYKIHPISVLKFEVLHDIKDGKDEEVVEYAMKDFDVTLLENYSPSMTTDEIEVIRSNALKNHASRIEAMKVRKLEKERRVKFNIAKRKLDASCKLKTAKSEGSDVTVMTDYLECCAWEHVTLDDYVKYVDTYKEWMRKSRGMSWDSFFEDVKRRRDVYNELGIRRVVRAKRVGDTDKEVAINVKEVHVRSEKDDYRNFWTWYNKVRLDSDPNVVGDAMKLAQTKPSLFREYKQQNPEYRITFSEWLANDQVYARALDLVESTGIDFLKAKDFVRHRVAESSMTVEEFCKYDLKSVKDWMKVNKEVKVLKMDLITIDHYLSNREDYDAFYLEGWWGVYIVVNATDPYGAYLEDKMNGWELAKSGAGVRHSASSDDDVMRKYHQNDLKVVHKALLDEIRKKVAVFENVDGSTKRQVHCKRTKAQRKADTDTCDNDDDDVFDDDRGFFDVKEKVTKVALLGRKTMYCLREVDYRESQESVNSTKICRVYFGPFSDEVEARGFKKRMMKYNKEKNHITMSLRVIENEDNTFDVVFRESKDPTKEKKIVKGKRPYLWIVNMFEHFITSLPQDAFALDMVETNIKFIRSKFDTSIADAYDFDDTDVDDEEAMKKATLVHHANLKTKVAERTEASIAEAALKAKRIAAAKAERAAKLKDKHNKSKKPTSFVAKENDDPTCKIRGCGKSKSHAKRW
jgi:hypothetical protein